MTGNHAEHIPCAHNHHIDFRAARHLEPSLLALVQPPPVRTFSRPRSSVGSRRGRGVRAEEQRVT